MVFRLQAAARGLGEWLEANAVVDFTRGDPLDGSLDHIEVWAPAG